MAVLSVLIIEDDAMIGMLLAEMLVENQCTVCAIAATEEDAVAAALQYKPDLMIVDEQLREGSGASAVQRILRYGPVACVFMSGAPVHFAGTGASVLQKPFLEENLMQAIRSATGGRPAGPA